MLSIDYGDHVYHLFVFFLTWWNKSVWILEEVSIRFPYFFPCLMLFVSYLEPWFKNSSTQVSRRSGHVVRPGEAESCRGARATSFPMLPPKAPTAAGCQQEPAPAPRKASSVGDNGPTRAEKRLEVARKAAARRRMGANQLSARHVWACWMSEYASFARWSFSFRSSSMWQKGLAYSGHPYPFLEYFRGYRKYTSGLGLFSL